MDKKRKQDEKRERLRQRRADGAPSEEGAAPSEDEGTPPDPEPDDETPTRDGS